MSMTWLETLGGPLVVVPRSALPQWSGIDGDDYDRACNVVDFLGVLELAEGVDALVLGDEPLRTTYLAEHQALVCWCYAEQEEGVADFIAASLPGTAWDQGPVVRTTGDLVMFDSAFPGGDIGEFTSSLVLELGAGRYRVDTTTVEPNEQTCFRVHRFVGLN